jgi:hypothetical protein
MGYGGVWTRKCGGAGVSVCGCVLVWVRMRVRMLLILTYNTDRFDQLRTDFGRVKI